MSLFKVLVDENKRDFFIVLSFFSIFIFLIIGCLFFPGVFYDNFIWRYYWGPVVADASDGVAVHKGVFAYEGYTLVSEVTYGLILMFSLYLIYRFLKKLGVKVDSWFALSLMPYIVYGSVTRVLEDSHYFDEPFVYWFISPLIYLQIAFFAVLFLFLGWWFKKRSHRGLYDKRVLSLSCLTVFMVGLIQTFLLTNGSVQKIVFSDSLIYYSLSCSAAAPLIYLFLKNKKFTVNTMIFSGGLLLLLPAVYIVFRWLTGSRWSASSGIRYDVFLIVIGVVFMVTLLVYVTAYWYRKNDKIVVYKKPLNLMMLFGHMLDGVTSYVSIKDPFEMGLSYGEKHPASNFLLNTWGPLFPVVKFFLIVLVIYVFDNLYKEELKSYPVLKNLLKIGILILGFSPGARDLLRVTMGV